MIFAEELIKSIFKKKINFFTGVPDSILKPLSEILQKKNKKSHIIATNEGSAISLGIGYYLSTKKIPCIYLQNSGLGNAINPLISVAHRKVYSIPMILLIGWRGSPNVKDEPQHKVKGAITKKLLKLMDIKYCLLKNKDDLKKLNKIIEVSKKSKKPVACLIEKNNLINQRNIKKEKTNRRNLKREEVIKNLLQNIKNKTNIISTTGFTSRELMQIRTVKNYKKGNDFYMVGGMGHSTMVTLGISLFSNKQTICLDGDGSILMHLGSLSTAGLYATKNFKHILLNNNSHESVGGQLTNADLINFKKLSKSLNYKKFFIIKNKKELNKKIKNFIKSNGPSFLEVKIKNGSMSNLMRPKPGSLKKIVKNFMINV